MAALAYETRSSASSGQASSRKKPQPEEEWKSVHYIFPLSQALAGSRKAAQVEPASDTETQKYARATFHQDHIIAFLAPSGRLPVAFTGRRDDYASRM